MVSVRDCIRSCIQCAAVLAMATGGLLAISTATVIPAGATSSKPLPIVSSPNASFPLGSHHQRIYVGTLDRECPRRCVRISR